MNTQPEHYSLNELIQLQDSGWDVNEMKSLSLIGPQWEHKSDSHIYFNKRSFFFIDLCRFFDSQLFCVFSTPQGELDYQLQDQDNVVFISTLHGG